MGQHVVENRQRLIQQVDPRQGVDDVDDDVAVRAEQPATGECGAGEIRDRVWPLVGLCGRHGEVRQHRH
ncbi:hypothetical protein [Georgenia sp. SYP-B2076]|uniref:hypothetical protein n=1 Tax=Georgenia sp. SYP-B2076 TaxID=2495881 RepID=UPI000F8C9213|nr:hypothetical protein [Georgenia sp. SYP-B2076]